MKSRTLKICIALLILNFSYSQKKTNGFTLECKLLNDYSGYIFLKYEDKIDSCLVENNHCYFKGKLNNDVSQATLLPQNKLSTMLKKCNTAHKKREAIHFPFLLI